MLSLFVATSGDNLPDLMYAAMDATGVGKAPLRNDSSAAALYFVCWLILGNAASGS